MLVVLAGLLFASAILNVALFSRARQYYLDVNAVRLNPIDLAAYSDDALAPSARPRLVFFGDSRAARWPFAAGEDRFAMINRGVEAETSAQAVLRFPAHVTALRPAVLLIQVGVNDLKTIPLFPERRVEIVSAAKQNIRHIVAQAKSLGAQVVVTTIFPVGEFPLERRMFWSPEIEIAVEEVNTDLRSLSADNVIVLDAAAVLTQAGRAKPEYYLDELHLNEAGYAALNQELARALSSIK
jgi:lysophospholipase L1-like esterase